LVGAARVVDGDLNDHEIIVSGDPKIVFAIIKIAFVILLDEHEAVVFRHANDSRMA
jgi:hypothetical protein